MIIIVVIVGVYLFNGNSKSRSNPNENIEVSESLPREFTAVERAEAMEAVVKGDTVTLKKWLDEGMSPDSYADVHDYKIPRPFLVIAIKEAKIDIIHMLFEYGASVDVGVEIDPEDPKDNGNFPVLWETIYRKNVDVAKIILDKVTPDTQAYTGIDESLTWSVAKNDSSALVKLIIDKGADIEYSWNANRPLIHAVMENNLDTVKLLVEAGADVNALAPYGEYFIGEDKRYIPEQFTALDCAIMWEHPEIAEYLRNVDGKEVYHF
ncbi:ankyrin repeat domain-containing protein [Cohnella mopanensis]|uniref:ankyrin repeat domain-containing protein n=1 Tax=Cohnella mopanensis TaxID=2911966 RepID=UPI001EF9519F|nr:ankyrin repeat domain-containing protein [Cohnella mopanensis]